MVKTIVEGVFIQKPENIDQALKYVRLFIRDVMREQHEIHENYEVVLDYTVASVGTKKRAKIDFIHPRMAFVDELKAKMKDLFQKHGPIIDTTKGNEPYYAVENIINFCFEFFMNEDGEIK